MESSENGVVEIEDLERGLLPDSARVSKEDSESEEDEEVLYTASFEEMEEHFVKYQTARWVLYSLLLLLAWGIGLFMFLYIPVRRCISRKDFRSRRLYITPNAIVYKIMQAIGAQIMSTSIVPVTRPVLFPCFGVLKKEKQVLLPSVADVVIEQGYLQSHFGVYSVRVENVGVRKPPSDDVKIQGIANPRGFRNAVLMRLSNMKCENYSKQISKDDLRASQSTAQWMSPSKSLRRDSEEIILQKLQEIGSSVKRVQTLIEEQSCQTSEPRPVD